MNTAKKPFRRLVALILVAVMISIILPVSFTASAESSHVVYGGHLWVDAPVAGLALCGKDDVDIFSAYTGASDQLSYVDPMEDVFETYSVTWYDAAAPTVALSSGVKAVYGKTYRVSVMMKLRSGYVPDSDFRQHIGTRINGMQPDYCWIYSDGYVNYVLYEKEFDTVYQSSTKPTAIIKEMELAPFEGQPMEIKLKESPGTNVRYQWQIVYGDYSSDSDDSSGWGSVINLYDNKCYQGCQTPNFKLHTFFGDPFDENDFLKLRCRVTSDSGRAYSQTVWFTIVDCDTVSSVAISGITEPVCYENPDMTATISSDKFTVTKVQWDQKIGDDTYQPVTDIHEYYAMTYRCRVYFEPKVGYKLADGATVTMNGQSVTVHTLSGKDKEVYGPDTYYVEREFEAKKFDLTITGAYITVDTPVAGALPTDNATSKSVNVKINSVDWRYYNTRYQQFVTMPGSMPFAKGGVYQCTVNIAAGEGYKFPEDSINLNCFINNKRASAIGTYTQKNAWFNVIFTIEEDTVAGDVNGDGKVDNADVEQLLWYTLFPDEYDVKCDADFNDDGQIDNQDVEYLLWHTLFPEEYPL